MTTIVHDHPHGAGPTRADDPSAGPDGDDHRTRLAVLGITAVAAVLYGRGLSHGTPHPFYTAAVRSMSMSWHDFLYGAFDPAGFITTDKLPGSYWPQALMARLFGWHTWAILLPSTACATATVPLLYGAVRRWAGPRAGLLAAACFTLTPITVALAHTNIPDTYLVAFAVAGVYAFTRALSERRLRWLVSSGVLFGVAFQMKMLQGMLAVPFLIGVYLATGKGRPLARAGRVAVFTAVTAAVSLSWMVFYSLTPAADRPAADGSAHGSIWEMVFVYNGLGRTPDGATAEPGANGPGPLRLFLTELGGQISWLLPLALLCLALGLWVTRRAERTSGLRSGWLVWGGWLLVYGAAISSAAAIHPYYTTSLAPAVAALTGAGIDLLASAWQIRDRRLGWALPVAVALTGGWALVVLGRTPQYDPWLRPLVAAATVVGVALLVVLRIWPGLGRGRGRSLFAVGTAAGVLAVAGAPAVWALSPLTSTGANANPAAAMAGPSQDTGASTDADQAVGHGGPVDGWSAERSATTGAAEYGIDTSANPRLLAYLRSHEYGERYLFATTSSMAAAPYVVQGDSVLPMGGFSGGNPAPSTTELQNLVHGGKLRYVLVSNDRRTAGATSSKTGVQPRPDGPGGDPGSSAADMFARMGGGTAYDEQAVAARQSWVAANCRAVSPESDGVTAPGKSSRGTSGVLYDCAGAH